MDLWERNKKNTNFRCPGLMMGDFQKVNYQVLLFRALSYPGWSVLSVFDGPLLESNF